RPCPPASALWNESGRQAGTPAATLDSHAKSCGSTVLQPALQRIRARAKAPRYFQSLVSAAIVALALPSSAFAAPRAPFLSPEESMKTFQLEPGLRIELVAAEPLVIDPVAMAFD